MNSTVLKGGAGAILLVLLVAAFWFGRDQFLVNPLTTELVYEYPGFAAADPAGNTYLIDRSLKRIVKTTADGQLVWALNGGNRDPGAFFFADELSVDAQGQVYVLNRVPDGPGFYTVKSQILQYSPEGTFVAVVAEQLYGQEDRIPTLVQRGHWHSLQTAADRVEWFDSAPTGLVRYTKTPGGTATVTVMEGPADLLVPSAAVLPAGQTAYITKQGRILRTAEGQPPTVIYDASAANIGSTPWKLRATGDGKLFFTDLNRSGIAELLPDGTAPLRFQEGNLPFYSLSVSAQGLLGTTGDAGARFVRIDRPGPLPPSSAQFTTAAKVIHYLLWLDLLATAMVVIALGWLVYVEGFRRSIPPFLKTVAGVIVLTATVGVLVSVIILNNFSQRYSTEVLSKITQLVHLVPRLIDTQKFSAVTEPGQFGGSDYLALRSQIIGAVYGDKNNENQGLYFALHKFDGTNLTTFMYLNGDTTIRHPFSYLNDPEGPYQKALHGETVAQYALDAWGSWMYSTGPIRDASGTILGVFEMGGDLYSFTQENNRLIQSLSINILTVLVIFLLVLVELTFLQDQLRKRTLGQALALEGIAPRRDKDQFHSVYLVRTVAGLFFISASLSLMFLPLMAKQFYHPLWGLPENVVYGLPVSVRLLFFGLGTIWGGNVSRRWGWRPVFLLGLAVSAGGLTAAAVSAEITLFLLSSVAIGLGAGVAMLGLRALVNAESQAESKAPGFGHFYAGVIAGTNVGVIVGSGLADLIGYSNVFWLSLALTLATAFTVLKLFPKPAPAAPTTPGELGVRQAMKTFFSDVRVGRFSLLIVLPVYVASMVLYFFLPVFAQEKGVSNADIGRIFLLNGLIIVYLGPALSRWFQGKLGVRRSLLGSSLLWTASLIPFVVLGDLWGLILTVVLMGVAEGVAAVAQNEHLLSLPVSASVGSDRAAGFFEVVGKLGETVAPILIGFAMLLGAQWGIGLVAGVLALSLIVYWIGDRPARREVQP